MNIETACSLIFTLSGAQVIILFKQILINNIIYRKKEKINFVAY